MSRESPTSSDQDWREKKVFTTGEAAQLCKVSQQTIIRCFDSGRLQGFRVPGSKFRRIPREELLRFMRANDIPTGVLESSGGPKVLVVDDDEQILELFREILSEDKGYEVRTASNGYDAGLLTERFKPDLVVLDYMLPDINGNVVCERIRENESLASTKILLVSGVVDRSEVEGLLQAGADGFIKKPFELDSLLHRIDELLGVGGGGRNGK